MAKVYLAHDEVSNRDVAIKILSGLRGAVPGGG